MQVGGGLRYVTGPMGSGKSLYGVRRIVQYVTAGKYAITNVKLYDDAPERIGFHFSRSKRKQALVADKVRRFYVYEEELGAAMRYRVPGRGESRALMIWDEAHNDLNNRSYRDRDQALLEWATQLRKLGYEGILLSQSHENTDAQLRRIANYLVRLQNQRETTRILGMRVKAVPPLFLAHWYETNIPAGSKQRAIRVERYFLSWHRNLYDTLDLYHGVAELEEQGAVVQLPEGGLELGSGSVAPEAQGPGPLATPVAVSPLFVQGAPLD